MIKQIVSLIFTTAFSIKAIHLWILFFRISISTFMLTHGLPKLSKLMSGDYEFADPLGIGMITSLVLASFSEAICSIFILFGAFTKIATIPPIITMAVAAFIVHQFDPFSKKDYPYFIF
ncbi:MAG TPA: DoxX family protein [Bacteroidia bacterium]|nr:DoxX family protein [Bacteroidia bacterium]